MDLAAETADAAATADSAATVAGGSSCSCSSAAMDLAAEAVDAATTADVSATVDAAIIAAAATAADANLQKRVLRTAAPFCPIRSSVRFRYWKLHDFRQPFIY